MSQDTARVRAEFDRIARLSGEHAHPNRYEESLLGHVPRPCRHALELGCGAGTLTRALADVAEHVTAVDLSPEMVRLARARCADRPNVEFLVGDFFALDLPPASFDCMAAVAVLHHMPLVAALERAKVLLRPGGVLLVLDLFRDAGLGDRLRSAVALLVDQVTRPRHAGSPELHAAWAEHGAGDLYPTIPQAREVFARALPGSTFRRHLLWRYAVVWTKPGRLAPDASLVGALDPTRTRP